MRFLAFIFLSVVLFSLSGVLYGQENSDDMIRQEIRVLKIEMNEDFNALDKEMTRLNTRLTSIDKRVGKVNSELDDLFIFMWIILGLFCIMTIAMTSFIITTKAMSPVVQAAASTQSRKKRAAGDDELEDKIDDVVGKLKNYKRTTYRKRRGLD